LHAVSFSAGKKGDLSAGLPTNACAAARGTHALQNSVAGVLVPNAVFVAVDEGIGAVHGERIVNRSGRN
jgi:hypothetical protein